VSRIALGCMSYGNPEWRKWMLSEEEGIEQIKFAYVPSNLIPDSNHDSNFGLQIRKWHSDF
jgi:hypothetical protein